MTQNGQFSPHHSIQKEELPSGSMNTASIDSCYELRTGFNKLYRPEAKWSIPFHHPSRPIKHHQKSGAHKRKQHKKQITCLLRNWDGNITRYWHANSTRRKKEGGHMEMQAALWWGMICSVCLIVSRRDRWELEAGKAENGGMNVLVELEDT